MKKSWFPIFFCLLFTPVTVLAGAPAAVPAAEMVGESLAYDIAFLWFDHLAEGSFTFAAGEDPGTYTAVLEAHTLGMAGWLTGDRIQRYKSIMRQGPDGALRSLFHEASIISGKEKKRKERVKRYSFDYDQGKVKYVRIKNGKITDEETLPLDRTAPPNDILTAFINFRIGVFGPLVPDHRYVIPTFSHRGLSEIVVETLVPKERSDLPFPGQGLLARGQVDPEVFDTGGGNIYIWFDEKGRPAKGAIENVIGLGNVRGSLR